MATVKGEKDLSVKVSICCAAYNHENYIRQTLDGFLMQKTNFPFEIIINDDASTDKTADIIREYEKKYPDIIKPLYQTENQYSKREIVRSFLYSRANGEYIAMCEGDDFWTDPEKLQKQVDFLDSHPEYSACVHKYFTVGEDGEPTYLKTFGDYEKGGRYTIKDLENGELPSQLASLVFRNIIFDEKKKYPVSFDKPKIAGDVKLFLYLLNFGDIWRMDETMSAYRYIAVVGGNSHASRSIGNYERPYIWWNACRELEKIYFKEYGKKINIKFRKLDLVFNMIRNLKHNHSLKAIKRTAKALIIQRGWFIFILKKATKKIIKIIKRGK